MQLTEGRPEKINPKYVKIILVRNNIQLKSQNISV